MSYCHISKLECGALAPLFNEAKAIISDRFLFHHQAKKAIIQSTLFSNGVVFNFLLSGWA